MLKIERLHAYYGEIEALRGINLEIGETNICCIIGSNGAGKTTLLKSISAVIQRKGSILWNGDEIINCSPRQIARLGIGHVAESRHIFAGMTVAENLEVGTVNWHGFFGRKPFNQDLDYVYEMFPRLYERRSQLGWSLSGGEQQMLAIGRALMGRPKLLMLDEPSMGLAPIVVEELFKKIVQINNEQKLPILLIEQNARLALNVSDYAYVLEHGAINFHGKAKDLSNDPRILEAYLGHFANPTETA